ncbi:hypothetical protein KNE206_48780 [Kitasatospora sp. NE20-6]|uniref:proprotein convertase P-domain-containing protein n=1 Tax=Kitasatospora sp. NE20-6 TaxID=2859066 RepID=UPI0034DBB132
MRNSIASGPTYTVAAGNQGADASEHSPARVPTATTVDLPIEEATADSRITVTGVPGRGPADLDIAVEIVHQYPDDLVVDLVAPDGSVHRLKGEEFTGGWDAGIHRIFGIDTSAVTAGGTWKLRVAGGSEYFSGHLDSWALQF